MATLAIDNDEIYARLAMLCGVSRDPDDWDSTTSADMDRIIRAGRRKLFSAYDWSFLEIRHRFATVEPYETGTVTIVSGVVTLAGGTFPTGAAGQRLYVDGNIYEVNTRDNGTQLTLYDTSIDADAGSEFVLYSTKYSLPSNYSAIVGPVTIENSEVSAELQELPVLPEHQVRGLASNQRAYSTRPKAFSVFHTLDEETGIPTYFLDLYPLPDRVYEVTVRVRIAPGDALAEVDEVFPAEFSELLLEAILAAAEQIWMDKADFHTELFNKMLPDFIRKDKVAQGVRRLLPRRDGRRVSSVKNYELIVAPIDVDAGAE